MLRITLFYCFLVFCVSGFSQNDELDLSRNDIETLTFEKNHLSKKNTAKADQSLFQEAIMFSKIGEAKVEDASLQTSVVLRVDQEVLTGLYDARYEYLSLELPSHGKETIILELARNELFTDDFRVVTSESNEKAVEIDPGFHYSGVVKGDPHSLVAVSLFKDELIGMISINNENVVIMPDKRSSDEDRYILYNDRDIMADIPFNCEALSHPEMKASPYSGQTESSNCVEVYLECDHALFNNKGGLTNTVNWITSVYNNVATLYSNENINTSISEIFVWTTPDSYSTSSSYTALTQFRNLRRTYNGDLAHLAALGGRGTGGIAWLDVLCSSHGYAYSNINSTYNNVPTYSWTVMVMTHEMGHNLGSNHTHWCGWTGGALDNCYSPEGGCSRGPAPTNGGTIMSYCHLTSYGINFNNGFGTQPGDKIRSEVAGAGCLGTSCGSGCNVPGGLAVSSITQTGATVSWSSVTGANSYDVNYRLNPSGSWTSINTTSTSYNLTGLTASTTYDVRVRAVCSGGASNWSGTVTFTTLSSGCGVPGGLSVSGITQSSANVSWNTVAGALDYDLQYRTNPSGSWSLINTGSTSYSLSGLSTSTAYDVRVRANCTGGSGSWSGIVTFTTSSGSSYCSSSGNSCSQEWIKRVRIGGIDRSSGCDNGYYDGTHLTGNVTPGAYNLIYFQAGRSGGSRTLYWRVWVDLNQNGSLTDAGELRVSGSSSSSRLLYAWVYIPSSATSGNTRMRISMRYGGYPGVCGSFSRGEVEDYTLNVLGTGTTFEDAPEIADESLTQLSIAPNPTSDDSRLYFWSPEDQEVRMTLIDIHGRPVKDWSYQSVEGSNFVDVPMSDLNSGQYLLRVDDGKNVRMLKILRL